MKHINFSEEEIFFDFNDSLCNDGKWSPENHYHNFMEIYFLEKGECDYFIDDRVYRVMPGDMVIIWKNILHNTVYGEKVCTRMLINCSEKMVPHGMAELNFPKAMLFRNSLKTEKIRFIFEEIKAQYENKNRYSEEIVACFIRLLLLVAGSSENEYAEKTRCKYTEAAVEYVKDNLPYNISLLKVAKHLSVSAEHLSRQFKKDTGISFSEYVGFLRLKKAEEMLITGKGKSITQIAHMCGFNDSNYFSSKFKKIYGVSPLKWKNFKNKLTKSEKNIDF